MPDVQEKRRRARQVGGCAHLPQPCGDSRHSYLRHGCEIFTSGQGPDSLRGGKLQRKAILVNPRNLENLLQ